MERKGITFLLWCYGMVAGFQTRPTITPRYAVTTVDDHGPTALYMAKKIQNKQAELAKKLALAKEQNALKEGVGSPNPRGGTERLSDAAIKERNDRLRFEELLKKQAASLNDISSDGYLSKQQEDAEIDAYQRGLDRIFEGDTAPTQPFEELVNIKSENAIGDTGMRRLVPWLKNTKSDYLIIVCDPRVQSPELRETVLQLKVGLPDDLLNKLIVINADTPAENRRWLKKGNLDNMTVTILATMACTVISYLVPLTITYDKNWEW